MGRLPFADDLFRFLADIPAIGKLLAWLAWITFASLTTTAVGLALIGLGVFAEFDATGTGKTKLPGGFEIEGNIRFLLVAGGLAVILVGGGLLADPPPQEAAPIEYPVGVPS